MRADCTVYGKLNGWRHWIPLLLALLVWPVQAADKLRLTNGEWPPYLSATLPHAGVASRIVSEAFKREGLDVEYGFFPWKRALTIARSPSWDGAAVWMHSAEREAQFYFSEPVVISGYVFFHRRDRAFDWQRLDDLRGLRIGATLEYDYGDAFTQAEAQGLIQVERVSRDELNFLKLLNGRIDLFPMDPVVGMEMLRQLHSATDAARLTFHPRPLLREPLYLLLSRSKGSNRELIERFNHRLRQLQEEGLVEVYLQESLGKRLPGYPELADWAQGCIEPWGLRAAGSEMPPRSTPGC